MTVDPKQINLSFVTVTEDNMEVVHSLVDDMMQYHPWDTYWDKDKISKSTDVRNAIGNAIKVILESVPPSPDRSAAIRKLREARMDCNSAITHDGRY